MIGDHIKFLNNLGSLEELRCVDLCALCYLERRRNKWILKFNLALDFEQWTFNNLETLQRMSPIRFCVFHALRFLLDYLHSDPVL